MTDTQVHSNSSNTTMTPKRTTENNLVAQRSSSGPPFFAAATMTTDTQGVTRSAGTFEMAVTARAAPAGLVREGGSGGNDRTPKDDGVGIGGLPQVSSLSKSEAALSSPSPSPSSSFCRLLYSPEDRHHLSQIMCIVRSQIEVFEATLDDVVYRSRRGGSKMGVSVGSVGLRCIHCARSRREEVLAAEKEGQQGKNPSKSSSCPARGSMSFPKCIRLIYQSVRNWQRHHLMQCPSMPREIKDRLRELKSCSKGSRTRLSDRSSGSYWELSCQRMGLVDTETGIRLGSEVVRGRSSPQVQEEGQYEYGGPKQAILGPAKNNSGLNDNYQKMEGAEETSSPFPAKKGVGNTPPPLHGSEDRKKRGLSSLVASSPPRSGAALQGLNDDAAKSSTASASSVPLKKRRLVSPPTAETNLPPSIIVPSIPPPPLVQISGSADASTAPAGVAPAPPTSSSPSRDHVVKAKATAAPEPLAAILRRNANAGASPAASPASALDDAELAARQRLLQAQRHLSLLREQELQALRALPQDASASGPAAPGQLGLPAAAQMINQQQQQLLLAEERQRLLSLPAATGGSGGALSLVGNHHHHREAEAASAAALLREQQLLQESRFLRERQILHARRLMVERQLAQEAAALRQRDAAAAALQERQLLELRLAQEQRLLLLQQGGGQFGLQGGAEGMGPTN